MSRLRDRKSELEGHVDEAKPSASAVRGLGVTAVDMQRAVSMPFVRGIRYIGPM